MLFAIVVTVVAVVAVVVAVAVVVSFGEAMNNNFSTFELFFDSGKWLRVFRTMFEFDVALLSKGSIPALAINFSEQIKN